MTTTKEVTMPNGDEIEIDFSAECHMENDGIGAYEYWGAKCYDRGVDYPVLDEDIKWNESIYTDEQNEVIRNQPQTFWDSIEKTLCENYCEEQSERAMEMINDYHDSRMDEWEEKRRLG